MDSDSMTAIGLGVVLALIVSVVTVFIYLGSKDCEITKRTCIQSNRPTAECATLLK